MRIIIFNEFCKIKDLLFSGSMYRIVDEFNLNVDIVRNFFGGYNFKEGKSVGIYFEFGLDGGLVMIDDIIVFDWVLRILDELNMSKEEVIEFVQV